MKEKLDLYKKMDKLLDKVGNTTNIQTNNIQLNNYGKENLSHITDKIKTKLISQPYGAIPKLIEMTHFNEEIPENQNILVHNIRDNKVRVFLNGTWKLQDKKQTITDLIDSKYSILDEHYETINDTLGNTLRNNFLKFKTFMDTEDKDLYEQMRKECNLILLNSKK